MPGLVIVARSSLGGQRPGADESCRWYETKVGAGGERLTVNGADSETAAPETMGGGPTVSIVVPARNARTDLDRCLSAIGSSQVRPLECIVVDDGSTDDTAEVARRHGARVIALQESHGPAYARNLGADAATGEILFFVDADVCLAPDAVGVMLRHFTKNKKTTTKKNTKKKKPTKHHHNSLY